MPGYVRDDGRSRWENRSDFSGTGWLAEVPQMSSMGVGDRP